MTGTTTSSSTLEEGPPAGRRRGEVIEFEKGSACKRSGVRGASRLYIYTVYVSLIYAQCEYTHKVSIYLYI